MPTPYSACAAAIRKAAPNLTDDDVVGILDQLFSRERATGKSSRDGMRWAEIARAMSAEEVAKATQAAKEARINAIRRAELDARVATIRGKGDQAGVQALSDLLTTSERAGAGRAFSLEARKLAANDEFLGALVADIESVNGWPLIKSLDRDKATERELAREISRLSGAKGVQATSNAMVRDVAEVLVRHRERVRVEMNAAGADIGRLPGYVGRTSHSMRRIEKAGFEAWFRDILPRLDPDTTFGVRNIDVNDAAAVQDFMRNVYSNLVSGVHHVLGRSDGETGFRGSGNLARALSEDRVLNFRDADAWLDYNALYGDTNLAGTIIGGIQHGATSIAMMRMFGTNPEAAFNGLARRLQERLRDAGDLKQAQAIKSALGGETAKLRREWRIVSGSANIPAGRSVATFSMAIRALNTARALGGVLLSQFTDLPAGASVLRFEGVNYWEALANNFKAQFSGVPKGVRREVAANLNAGYNGFLGGLYHRMGYTDGVTGRTKKGLDLYFKVTLQERWTNAMERGTSFMLSRHVARNLSKSWDSMDAGLRTGLARYGVTADDWAAAQRTALLRDGKDTYFHPGLLREIGEGASAEKFGAWFATIQEGAVSRPSSYANSLMFLGLPPGSALGESLRMLWQFKSYPMAVISRHLAREMYRGGDGASAQGLANVAQFIAMATIFGAASVYSKRFFAGRNPPSFDSAQDVYNFASAAMVQGGGLGIYGDFLFGDFNRFGGSFWSTTLGPTAGTVEQVAKLYARARDDAIEGGGSRSSSLAAGASRLVISHIPGINIFYTKLALEHLVLHHLQEALSPGYLNRLERRIKRENNQTFWLRPNGELGEGPIADAFR